MKPIIYEDNDGAYDEQDIKELIAENKKLIDALKFYADSKWNDSYPGGITYEHNGDFYVDIGGIAKQALK